MSEATVAVNEGAIEPRLVGADARVAGPARILIVDDELAIRESLDALLEHGGLRGDTGGGRADRPGTTGDQ